MHYKQFRKDDIIHNSIIAHPEYEFFINNKKVYLNRETAVSGDFSNTVKHVAQGSLSLTEMNINRPATSLVKPFYVYDGIRENMFNIGSFPDTGASVDGQYPMAASISRVYFDKSETTNNIKYMHALKNPIDNSGELSTSNDHETILTADANILGIPSIFYGSGIKKGSIKMNFYVNGTLTATLEDTEKNGKLIETYGPNLGSVNGISLYDYGILVLTGAASLHDTHQDKYFNNANGSPSWLSFGSGMSEINPTKGSNQNVSSAPSYSIYFKGTNKIPTMTLMAHAEMGELNYSFNPTYVDKDTPPGCTAGIDHYIENKTQARNIRKSKYKNFNEEYENITYISQIGIYDKDKNLIGIAKLANPVKKTEIQDYMFKLRLDF